MQQRHPGSDMIPGEHIAIAAAAAVCGQARAAGQVYQHTTAAAAIISEQTSKFHDHDFSCGLYLIFTLHVLARLGKYVIVIHITMIYCLRGLHFIIKGSFF